MVDVQTDKPNILIVDDEPDVLSALARFLLKENFLVKTASGGEEALALYPGGSFDLVITDHGMPVMNGLDTAFRIKKLSPETPVLLITGWQTDSDAAYQKPSGVDEFVSKPFDLEKPRPHLCPSGQLWERSARDEGNLVVTDNWQH